MMDTFELPEAEEFSKYLRENTTGSLTHTERQACQAETGLWGYRWFIFHDGSKLGVYTIMGQDYSKHHEGAWKRCPRFYQGTDPKTGKDVSLELNYGFDGSGKLGLMRKDEHADIPFA